MEHLEHTVNKMKKMYREIFQKSSDAITARIEAIRPKDFDGDIFKTYTI